MTASAGGGPPEMLGLLVGAAVFGLILWRQRRVRLLRSGVTGPVVLAVVGLGSLSSYVRTHQLSGGQLAWIAAVLVLDAVGLGAIRALTVRVWTDDSGRAWRQGSWWTLALWIVGAAAHEVADGASGVGLASALLYLGLTLLAQRLVLSARMPAAHG